MSNSVIKRSTFMSAASQSICIFTQFIVDKPSSYVSCMTNELITAKFRVKW